MRPALPADEAELDVEVGAGSSGLTQREAGPADVALVSDNRLLPAPVLPRRVAEPDPDPVRASAAASAPDAEELADDRADDEEDDAEDADARRLVVADGGAFSHSMASSLGSGWLGE